MPDIRVALVEDNDAMREGLKMVLSGSPGFTCVCALADAESALHRIPLEQPDVVLMDIHLPGQSGIECVRQLRAQIPNLRIIMLTIEANSQRVFHSLQAGASGYLVKNLPPAEILECIQEAHRGGAPMSSQIARMVVQSFHQRGAASSPQQHLTPREAEVLDLFAQGYRTKEVAESLTISTGTVESHLRNIYAKLHVRSIAGAVAHSLRPRN